MNDEQFIFLAGHHRSGTSLVHEIIRDHPEISGFSDTKAHEDEGQHLQSVYEPAKSYGGPGKYIFHKFSYMNEDHNLAVEASAKIILNEWNKYYDQSCSYFIEKSPPNLVRTRFLQKLFPNSKFIVIMRHPIAVGYATQKWSQTSIKSLIEHTLKGYEIFRNDLPHLKSAYVFRYEDFVQNPQIEIDKICSFIGLDPIPVMHDVRSNVNNKYFEKWDNNRSSFLKRLLFPVRKSLEKRANNFGYSMKDYDIINDSSILGLHENEKNLN